MNNEHLFVCPFEICKLQFKADNKLEIHINKQHLMRGTTCLGCYQEYSNEKQRNQHHTRCVRFKEYFNQLIRTCNAQTYTLPTNQTQNNKEIMEEAKSVPINYNNHCTTDNSTKIGYTKTLKNSYNIQPTKIHDMIRCLS